MPVPDRITSMEDESKGRGSNPTTTQPVTVDLRSFVMRLMEKERKHPGGLIPPSTDNIGTLACRQPKNHPPNPGI